MLFIEITYHLFIGWENFFGSSRHSLFGSDFGKQRLDEKIRIYEDKTPAIR